MDFYIDGSILKPTYNKSHRIGEINKIPKIRGIHKKNEYFGSSASIGYDSLNNINTILISVFKNEEIDTKQCNYIPELKSAINVLQYCLDNNIKKVKIFYDCITIEELIYYSNLIDLSRNVLLNSYKKSERKRIKRIKNNIYYKTWIDIYNLAIKNRIQIKFFKIKSHSGNIFNNLVDKLTQQAVYKWLYYPQCFTDKYNYFDSIKDFNKYICVPIIF